MKWLESSIAVGLLLALVSCWTLWTAAYMRWRNRLPLLPAESRREVPWNVFDVLATFILMIALPLAGLFLLQSTTSLLPTTHLEQLTADGRAAVLLMSSAASLLTLGITFVVLMAVKRATWEDLGVSPRFALIDLFLGVGAFFMLAPLVYVIMLILTQWFPSEHPLVKIVKENPEVRFFALSFFSAVVVAPIVEEFLFRVVLQGWLERVAERIRVKSRPVAPATSEPTHFERPIVTQSEVPRDNSNPYAPPLSSKSEQPVVAELAVPGEALPGARPPPFWPILVSSAIFALMHLGHGPDPVPLFVLAVGLGYLYRQTHRVLPGIVVHMILNAVSMILLLISVYADGAFKG